MAAICIVSLGPAMSSVCFHFFCYFFAFVRGCVPYLFVSLSYAVGVFIRFDLAWCV